jgi:hypothetical protein
MSCTFAAPPGTAATIRSISSCVSVTSGSICGVIRSQSAGIPFGGTSTGSPPPPTAPASADNVGVVNNAPTSACSSACLIRSITVTASNE